MANRDLPSVSCRAAALLLLSGAQALAQAPPAATAVQRVVSLTVYPRLAQLSAVQGEARLIATIKPGGTVDSVRTIAGRGILSHDAERTVMK